MLIKLDPNLIHLFVSSLNTMIPKRFHFLLFFFFFIYAGWNDQSVVGQTIFLVTLLINTKKSKKKVLIYWNIHTSSDLSGFSVGWHAKLETHREATDLVSAIKRVSLTLQRKRKTCLRWRKMGLKIEGPAKIHYDFFPGYVIIFKASALWADAFYKSKCPSVCLSVRLSVRL